MSDRPAASDLLATARAALLDELLPRLPDTAHYTARMIAHAMAVAGRDAVAPPLPDDLCRDLAQLAGTARDLDVPTPDLDAVARALADRLRRGDFAPGTPQRAQLHRALAAWTRARLAISEPRALRDAPDR
jgi:hypothetical protein